MLSLMCASRAAGLRRVIAFHPAAARADTAAGSDRSPPNADCLSIELCFASTLHPCVPINHSYGSALLFCYLRATYHSPKRIILNTQLRNKL